MESSVVSVRLVCGIAALLLAAFPLFASAKEYPSRAITIVVPFAPGGGPDVLGRMIGQQLSIRLGKPIVVENKRGAGSMLGAGHVAKATPDGHTILLATNSAIAVAPILYKAPLFNSMNDFVPLSMVSGSPMFLAVNPKGPVQSVKDLIAFAKKKPKQLSFSTSGPGSTAHIFMELFMQKAGVELLHVPYPGSASGLNDVIAGHVHMSFTDPNLAVEMSKSGLVRLIGISTSVRHPAIPDVPTISEAGVSDFNSLAWVAMVAPAQTPSDIVQTLHREISEIVNGAEFKGYLEKNGSIVMNFRTTDAISGFFRSEIEFWGDIVRKAGIAGSQ
jgi:tripartite-type tricarboxylate transporter receptor subunit TctC